MSNKSSKMVGCNERLYFYLLHQENYLLIRETKAQMTFVHIKISSGSFIWKTTQYVPLIMRITLN